MTLTKSDFILADDCLAKLYFKENAYLSNSENPYMDYLAILTLGPGTEIQLSKGLDHAVQETKNWIKSNKRGPRLTQSKANNL